MLAIGLCSAALLGLVIALGRSLDAGAMALCLVLSALGTVVGWRLPATRALGLASVACLLGALRVALVVPSPAEDIRALLGGRALLQGRVATTPATSGSVASLQLDITHAAKRLPAGVPPLESASGRVEVTSRTGGLASRLEVGDWVTVDGRLEPVASTAGFPRAEILSRQGVMGVVAFPRLTVVERSAVDASSFAAAVRARVGQQFERYLPQPQASLAIGMLLGGSADLGTAFKRELQTAGLGHLVAVSGYNIVVVAAAVYGLLVRTLGRRASLVPSLAAIAAYTALAGFPASGVRAALMVAAGIVAGSVGRVADPFTGVLLAATVMGFVQPGVLLDVGFQLSTAATLGLILLYPRIHPWLARAPRWVAEPLALSLAAELATLPIVLSVFHQVSLVGPLANVLAAPLVPLIMASAAALALVLEVPGLAPLVGWVVWLPTTLLAVIARTAGTLPGAGLSTGHLPLWGAVALTVALGVWGLTALPELGGGWRWVRARLAAVPHGRVAAGCGAAVVALAWALLLSRPDGLLHVTVLAAGKGSATLVRGPDGSKLLVSGTGVDPRGLASLVADQLNLWERSVDTLVVLDRSHEPGLVEVERRYAPAQRLLGGRDARVRMGDAVVDLFAAGPGGPSVGVGYGRVWFALAGQPPLPAPSDGDLVSAVVSPAGWPEHYPTPFVRVGPEPSRAGSTYALSAPRETALELVSDGVSVWPLGGAPPAEEAGSD